MDLGMNDSVPESVEDNGSSVPADSPEVMIQRSSESIENVSVNGLLVLPDDDDDREEGIGSPQQSNKPDGFRVESPGGSVHSTRKGFGLKKWRRIKRDGPVKDESTPVDDGSKLLKRGLTGSVNPPAKHVDVSSVEARQSQASEKSEEHIGNFRGKKGSEERVKVEKEKPCSSLDSDLRSSDFVFSSGAVSVANNGEKDERLMNHIGEYSKEGRFREEVETYSRSENGDKEEDGDESKKNYNHWVDKDPLADSIRNFAALQEALWKEVQSFQELGKDFIPLHKNANELSSPDQSGNENCREENSASSGSHALNLKQTVKHLEHKLEEARAVLEAKESRIQELENSKIESELEGIFKRKIETEIELLMLTRSLKSLQALKQPKKVHFLIEDPESNRGDILGKSCKFGFYFLTQLILLVSILWFLVLQFSPASLLVIPT
ncbi:unnamed protein product [Arabis nemorensis]|uniref:WPP domain-containing protein n=1 Tax=Arabis nemorensis TaxID=586526 RepID=A0A565B8M5_9BRAS|nr:unnamed protein product [Arabis nemorensis]